VIAADVEERHRADLAAGGDVPHLGIGQCDETLGLDEVVGDARTGNNVDGTLDAVVRGEDGNPGLAGVVGHGVPQLTAWRAKADEAGHWREIVSLF